MVTTERYKAALVIKHLKAAMESIKNCAMGKAETLTEAKSRLTLIEVISSEALFEAALPSET